MLLPQNASFIRNTCWVLGPELGSTQGELVVQTGDRLRVGKAGRRSPGPLVPDEQAFRSPGWASAPAPHPGWEGRLRHHHVHCLRRCGQLSETCAWSPKLLRSRGLPWAPAPAEGLCSGLSAPGAPREDASGTQPQLPREAEPFCSSQLRAPDSSLPTCRRDHR